MIGLPKIGEVIPAQKKEKLANEIVWLHKFTHFRVAKKLIDEGHCTIKGHKMMIKQVWIEKYSFDLPSLDFLGFSFYEI